MKKRLEAELISIAHRILKLKNKSEVDQLYKETQKLYETLAVLKFYQDNYESAKDEVAATDLDEKLQQHIETETPAEPVAETVTEAAPQAEVETEAETEVEEEVLVQEEESEPMVEEAEEAVAEEEPETVAEETEERIEIKNDPEEIAEQPVVTPMFELTAEEEEEETEQATETTSEAKQASLEELLGGSFVDPVFVKPNEVTSVPTTETKEQSEPKTTSLNAAFSKTLEIGLNDRIAFVNNLFGESNEDFNRVISQLNTFENLEDAKTFLNEMVIPEYNYWVGKEEYIERFMEILEKKFV